MKYYAVYELDNNKKAYIINILPDYNSARNFCELFLGEKLYISEIEADNINKSLDETLVDIENILNSKGEHNEYLQ